VERNESVIALTVLLGVSAGVPSFAQMNAPTAPSDQGGIMQHGMPNAPGMMGGVMMNEEMQQKRCA